MPDAVTRGLALAAGAKAEPEEDRAAKLKRLRAEKAMLEKSVGAVGELMEAARAEASLRAAEAVRDRHRGVLRQVWEAAAAFSAALDTERTLFAELLVAGFEGRPDILQRPGLHSGVMLGSLLQNDSEISRFRRQLEQQGII